MKVQKIHLKRKTLGNYNSLFGILTVETNKGKFYFSSVENYEERIPEGVYSIDYTHSPKFNRPLPIILDVPNRNGIRIHTANRGNDVEGCIGLGLICKTEEIPQQI